MPGAGHVAISWTNGRWARAASAAHHGHAAASRGARCVSAADPESSDPLCSTSAPRTRKPGRGSALLRQLFPRPRGERGGETAPQRLAHEGDRRRSAVRYEDYPMVEQGERLTATPAPRSPSPPKTAADGKPEALTRLMAEHPSPRLREEALAPYT